MENAIRFRKSFNRMKWVKVPKVYKGLSNENMIVMEYVESEKLADISDPDVNGKKVCQALINSYVIQHGLWIFSC